MAPYFRHSTSLRSLVLLSWFAPAVLTLLASIGLFVFLGWLDYENGIEVASVELADKSTVAARRISAELMLQELGSKDAVLKKLKDDLHLESISLATSSTCVLVKGTCSKVFQGQLLVVREIPHIVPAQFIAVGKSIRPFQFYLNLKILLWSTVPVFFLIATGLLIQLRFLRKKIIDPVNSLVDAAERHIEIEDDWPVELKKIGSDLKDSFIGREQVIFAILAKGVIHDIKTFMHSLLIATDLISETNDETSRRNRLENLFNASKSNLPKIKRIIELTLDGSREIPIHFVEASVAQTLKGAIDTNQVFASERKVEIRLANLPEDIICAHDPVQLERAFANIIKNAIEAVSSQVDRFDGKAEVAISLEQRIDGNIQVVFEDSGPGLGVKITSDFMPIKSSKAHGSGLGLYITRKIIQGHHGQLSVLRSSLLGGAKFLVALPKGGAI